MRKRWDYTDMINKPRTVEDLLELVKQYDELTERLEQLRTQELIASTALKLGTRHPEAEDGVSWHLTLSRLYIETANTTETLHLLEPFVDKCIGLVQYMGLRRYERYIADSRNHWINRSAKFRVVRIPPEWRRLYREPKLQPIALTVGLTSLAVDTPSPYFARTDYYEYEFRQYAYKGLSDIGLPRTYRYWIAANQEANTVLISV